MSDLDELVFKDETPPDFAAPGPADVAPATDDVLSCAVCGVALEYSGRGRKPQRCPEHRRASGSTKSAPKNTTNERLAVQATEALVQINRLTGFGLRVLGMPETGATIAYAEDVFREQALAALMTDPGLCKQILAAGQVSAKASLALAYGMLGMQVAPVAMLEIKAKREAKAEAKANAHGEDV